MSLTLQERRQAAVAINNLAQSDPDVAVRARAQEIIKILRASDHGELLQQAGQVANNTSATTANRLRALDIIERLIRA